MRHDRSAGTSLCYLGRSELGLIPERHGTGIHDSPGRPLTTWGQRPHRRRAAGRRPRWPGDFVARAGAPTRCDDPGVHAPLARAHLVWCGQTPRPLANMRLREYLAAIDLGSDKKIEDQSGAT